jgi:hypothetical protein
MAIRKSSSSGIPFGNTAGRPASPGTGQLYSNGQLGRLELYTDTGWQNIVQETPGIASITGTYNESAGSGTFVISGTNFVTGGIAYAVGTNGTEYQATTSTTNSIVQMTAVFTGLSPAYEPYDIKVLNPSNLFGLIPDAFYINDNPIWTTSAGSLGTFNSGNSVSLQLATTDDESNTITYSVSAGSLPGGLSLSSSGLISGTIIAVSGTYSFTVSASDGSNTGQTRAFSITSVASSVTGGTLSSDATYYYRTFTGSGNLVVSNTSLPVNVMVVAGGGAGGHNSPANGYHQGGGGGGAGGLRVVSTTAATGTNSITVGGGGSASGYSVTNGVNSSALSIESSGGGYGCFNPNSGQGPANSGGSGGGASRDSTTPGSGNTPSTSPSQGNTGGGIVGGNPGAGGGGAGEVGGNAGSSTPGNGGSGSNAYSSWLTAISSSMSGVSGWTSATGSGYIAGGGGGGAGNTNSGTSSGGAGGGAGQPSYNGSNGVAGITNTGGGGSGSSANTNPNGYQGGPGGSGLVVVRYTKASVGG